MSQFIPTPLYDVPFRSQWRIDFERGMSEPQPSYRNLAPKRTNAPRRVRYTALPRAEVRDCKFSCGRQIKPRNKTGACYECQKSYLIMAGPKPKCVCGQVMNRKTKFGVCARCADLRRWRGSSKAVAA